MSEFDGLWEHRHTQHAPWGQNNQLYHCCCSMEEEEHLNLLCNDGVEFSVTLII